MIRAYLAKRAARHVATEQQRRADEQAMYGMEPGIDAYYWAERCDGCYWAGRCDECARSALTAQQCNRAKCPYDL